MDLTKDGLYGHCASCMSLTPLNEDCLLTGPQVTTLASLPYSLSRAHAKSRGKIIEFTPKEIEQQKAGTSTSAEGKGKDEAGKQAENKT